MKFRRGAWANTSGATGVGDTATLTVAATIWLRYQAVMAPSPWPITLHQAVVVDLGDRLVGRRVLGPAGDVFDVAVAEVGPHEQLLRRARLQHRGGRQDLQPRQPRVIVLRRRHAGGDPLGEHAVLQRVDVEPHAAPVRHRAGRLGQQQAAARIGRDHAPAARLPRDLMVVSQRDRSRAARA